MHPGTLLTLSIEKPVAGGRMLARHDGAIVLVSGAIPGERVEARVERTQRGTVWAAAATILEPSADRVGEPNACGGCLFAHIRYDRQLALKQQILVDAFARIARLPVPPPPIAASPAEGYRMRARLHVHGPRVGFYNEGSHVLCDPATTGQLRADTLGVLGELGQRLGRDGPHVRVIELAENRDATERAVHIELAAGADPSRLGTISQVAGLRGVSASHEGSPRVKDLWGEPRVSDVLGRPEWTLTRSARSFFQANRYLLDALVDQVVSRVEPGPTVDLYAGVGLFGLAVAAAGTGAVVAVEGDPAASADLQVNAAQFDSAVDVRRTSVESFLGGKPAAPTTVVLDPPRTGLSPDARAGLVSLNAGRLIYVSCDVATLARDVRALVDGGYRLEHLSAFDLFPNTAHVESLAVLGLGAAAPR